MPLLQHSRPIVDINDNMGEEVESPDRERSLSEDKMDDPNLASMAKQLLHYAMTLQRGEEPKDHPTPEWLGKFRVLANQQLSGSGLPLPGQMMDSGLGVQLADYRVENSTRLGHIETILNGMQVHKVLDKVANRQSELDWREREHGLRVGMFANEYVKQQSSLTQLSLLGWYTQSYSIASVHLRCRELWMRGCLSLSRDLFLCRLWYLSSRALFVFTFWWIVGSTISRCVAPPR